MFPNQSFTLAFEKYFTILFTLLTAISIQYSASFSKWNQIRNEPIFLAFDKGKRFGNSRWNAFLLQLCTNAFLPIKLLLT